MSVVDPSPVYGLARMLAHSSEATIGVCASESHPLVEIGTPAASIDGFLFRSPDVSA